MPNRGESKAAATTDRTKGAKLGRDVFTFTEENLFDLARNLVL